MANSRGLVLQGGGALGAFELGAARAVYSEKSRFRPDVIAGVSIGAISATLLARPARRLTPLAALEAFWKAVTSWDPSYWPATAMVAVPAFYRPSFPPAPFNTAVYDTSPLLSTLAELIDQDALKDPAATPRLQMTATEVCAGSLALFDSADRKSLPQGLSLKHVLASGSLPPNFPATEIDGTAYWDGGVFDNTPLGAVIDALDGEDPQMLVVNLFPKQTPMPTSFAEVMQTFQNLLFVNKTESDLKLLARFNQVVDLVAALKAEFPPDKLQGLPGWDRLQKYRRVKDPIQVTRASEARPLEGADFSAAGIARRAAEGQALTETALKKAGLWDSR
ncbi:MAG TPA: patatin-like phospholipase family protein [Phenylobacterium sp.]|nr:patatin-like phospholipase family protein [Phenylobacterium sp.]